VIPAAVQPLAWLADVIDKIAVHDTAELYNVLLLSERKDLFVGSNVASNMKKQSRSVVF